MSSRPEDKWLEQVKIDDLDGDQRVIAEIVGMDAYRNLVRTFGGNQIRIYQASTIIRPYRDAEIQAKYNGHNERWLCQHYQLSDRVIREITQSARHIEGQSTLWDNG